VRGDELVVLGQSRGALCGSHRERRVELLHHVLEVEGIDTHTAVEHWN